MIMVLQSFRFINVTCAGVGICLQNMKTDFEHTKAEHERAQEYFKELKTARDVAKREFDSLQDSFRKSQATFQSKQNYINDAECQKGNGWTSRTQGLIIGKDKND